jgi:hypothetical protein
MVKRVYIDGKRTDIEIRDEPSSSGNADMPWPMTMVILALFVWFLSWGNWLPLKIFWIMLKAGFYCMGGFLFVDVDQLF